MEISNAAGLRLFLFGPLRAYVDGHELIGEHFTRRKVKALLAYLYLRRGQYISKDQLLEALWPEIDDVTSASGRLKQNILVLRHTLEGHKPARSGWRYILEHGGSYFFNTRTAYYSDLEEFELAVEKASVYQKRGDMSSALLEYQRGLALYRADLLQDFRYDDWAAVASSAVRERYLTGLEQTAQLYGLGGEYDRAIELLTRAIQEEPLRESTSMQMMNWLWRRGDHADALRVYLALQSGLANTLQLEPKAEATALFEAIRRDRAIGWAGSQMGGTLANHHQMTEN